MFYWRSEGETVRNGLNVYPLKDEGSAGFILRLWRIMFRVRYSKRTKEWYRSIEVFDCDGFYYR